MFYEKRCSYKLHKIHRKTPVPESFLRKSQVWGLQLYYYFFILAQVLSCQFCEMSTNTLFPNTFGQLLLISFVAGFFIFSIVKNFRHEKARFVRKKLTSGKPAQKSTYSESFFSTQHWDKSRMLNKISDKINVFFYSQAPTHHTSTFN